MFPGRLAILIAPSAPRPSGQNNGAVGYADRFNLRTLTVGALVFVATAVGSLEVELWLLHCLTHLLQVHYALSADAKCLWSAKAGPGFNNLLFYQRIPRLLHRGRRETGMLSLYGGTGAQFAVLR